MKRFPVLTWVVAASAAAAYVMPGGFEVLSYSRPEILGGELWRLLTCHITHGSFTHLAWDVALFLLLGIQAERRFGRRYPALLAGSALAVGLGLLVFLPNLEWYCGLSGIDTALFGALVIHDGRKAWREGDRTLLALNALWIIGLAAKIGYEYATGQMMFVHTPGLPPVPAAHLLGAAAGMQILILTRIEPRPGVLLQPLW